MENWISFRASPTGVELRVGETIGVVSLARFRSLVEEFCQSLEANGDGTLGDQVEEPLQADEGAPSKQPKEPQQVAPVVDPDRPWLISGRAICPPLELLYRPSTRVPSPGEQRRWYAAFRTAAKGDREAMGRFEEKVFKGMRGDDLVFRLHSLLLWLRGHPEISVDQILLPGEEPSERDTPYQEETKLFADSVTRSILNRPRREHPLEGRIGIEDPIVRGELSRQHARPVKEPGPFSFEALYPIPERTSERRTFVDDFRGNPIQDAQQQPKPEPSFSPLPGEKGNE